MKVAVITVLLLLVPQAKIPDQLALTDHGHIIESVYREDYFVSYLNAPFIDEDKLHALLNKLERKIYQAPVDAALDDDGMIIPEQSGMKLDRKKFQVLFHKHLYRQGHNQLELPKQMIYPRVDSELLDRIREQKIGEYVTYFKTSNKERSHTIELSADTINNYVLFPGDTFSFNQVVGKRTKEKGYLPAPVIVKGELAEDVGGGICQVSSTLFNAVDRAGMTILQRYSHSRSVPYVPPGRDATVSWYGPDFKFKNKYSQPIIIRAKTKNGKMFIKILTANFITPDTRKVPSVSTEF
jgi:vancomycin resistance protein YoaR